MHIIRSQIALRGLLAQMSRGVGGMTLSDREAEESRARPLATQTCWPPIRSSSLIVINTSAEIPLQATGKNSTAPTALSVNGLLRLNNPRMEQSLCSSRAPRRGFKGTSRRSRGHLGQAARARLPNRERISAGLEGESASLQGRPSARPLGPTWRAVPQYPDCNFKC